MQRALPAVTNFAVLGCSALVPVHAEVPFRSGAWHHRLPFLHGRPLWALLLHIAYLHHSYLQDNGMWCAVR